MKIYGAIFVNNELYFTLRIFYLLSNEHSL